MLSAIPDLVICFQNDNQDHLQPLHQQRPQLAIHPIENLLSDSSGNAKMIDNEANKVPVMEVSLLSTPKPKRSLIDSSNGW